MDENMTVAESLASINGWIMAVGSDADLADFAGKETQVFDLGGRTVLPGFIDAHEHLSHFSEGILLLDLSPENVGSLAELLARIKEAASKALPGEWIRGILYDDTKMAEGRILTRDDLDQAAVDNPVLVSHVSVHWGVVNSAGLKLADLNDNSPDPEGGVLGRDPDNGRLTGQVVEKAFFNFAFEPMTDKPTVIPPFDRELRKKVLVNGAQILNAAGVTGVGDALVSPSYVTTYHDLAAEGALSIRVNMLISHLFLPILEQLGLTGRWGNEWVRCTGIKIIVDGAIAGRTAALKDGYQDDPANHGVLLIENQTELDGIVERIHRMGYQACIHANGDLAIAMALNAIEQAQKKHPRLNPRHRIEHCTMIEEDILARMKALGAVALPFGSYLWQHGEKLRTFYGPKADNMFAHGSFLRAGVRVAGSSDHPAGLLSPLLGVQSMVTRRTASGDVIGPDEKISIEEAFKMYGIYAAYASFEERIKGSLVPGKLADLVVLGADPWKAPAEEIGQIPVDTTILGGEVIHSQS
jgi:predicted amidohydrolase YtcJ